jgi:Protein of unknown function (DUF4058)
MPIHDWTRVEAGIFHDFHVAWIPELRKVLNGGMLPEGYYALAEQHVGRTMPDLLTLHIDPAAMEPLPPATGGTIVAERPPRVRRKLTVESSLVSRRRSLAIRHVSGHRLIALVEILSPANKDRARHVEEFASKIVTALEAGVHVLLVDLFPPGPHDPDGMHGAIHRELGPRADVYDLPQDEPLTLASYVAEAPIDVYLEHLAIGATLPAMPLFLHPDRYIDVPLEQTYMAAYQGTPAFWRNVLEGRGA